MHNHIRTQRENFEVNLQQGGRHAGEATPSTIVRGGKNSAISNPVAYIKQAIKWSEMSTGQKASSVIGIILLILAIVALIYFFVNKRGKQTSQRVHYEFF